jgi:hypothetical protein
LRSPNRGEKLEGGRKIEETHLDDLKIAPWEEKHHAGKKNPLRQEKRQQEKTSLKNNFPSPRDEKSNKFLTSSVPSRGVVCRKETITKRQLWLGEKSCFEGEI